MSAVVEILSGELMGRAYDVDEGPFTIGRKEDCAIVLPKKYVSRVHAELVQRDGRWVVRGLSKKNPIVIRDREVDESPLSDGDVFEICGIQFRFRASGSAAEVRGGPRSSRGFAAPTAGAGAPTSAWKRPAAGPGADDIEDGPLPQDEESVTEAFEGGVQESGGRPAPSPGAAQLRSASGADGQPGWRAAPTEGPRGRVVFGDDDEAGPASSAAKKGAKASGSGDDKEERTDQIDISKLKKEEDPFAEKKEPEKKSDGTSAERERLLKFLVVAGALAIVVAGGMVWYYMRPPERRTIHVQLRPPVPIGETRRYEQPWTESDAPQVARTQPSNGDPTDIIHAEDPNVAVAEWAVPEVTPIYFLVTGVAAGQTTFEVWCEKNTRVYHIEVSGTNKHELLRKARKEQLAPLGPDDLRRQIKELVRMGEELKATGDNSPQPERYPRRVKHVYELAKEAYELYEQRVNQTGVPDPDLETLRNDVKDHLERAHQAWTAYLAQRKRSYDELCKRAQWADAAKELQAVCWSIGDSCDPNYQRYQLLLEKIYAPRNFAFLKGGVFEGPGCVEEKR